MKKTLLLWSVSLGLVLLCCAGFAEVVVRLVFLPRDFFIFHVRSGDFPHFGLKRAYQDSENTIREGRREKATRGSRSKSVAFIGNSETYGVSNRDEDIFTERLQQSQKRYDVYNYGVPGYGVLEVEWSLGRAIREVHPQVVVYTYNLNDPVVAMAGLLPLLTTPETRFSTIEEYQGVYGRLKLLTKDHFKSFFVIPHLIRESVKVIRENVKSSERSIATISSPRCLAEVEADLKGRAYATQYQIATQSHRDPRLLRKLKGVLERMARTARDSGARFLIVYHFDLPFVLNRDLWVPRTLDELTAGTGTERLNPYSLYTVHFRECGFYSDPGHLGPLGHKYMAEALAPVLSRLVP